MCATVLQILLTDEIMITENLKKKKIANLLSQRGQGYFNGKDLPCVLKYLK